MKVGDNVKHKTGSGPVMAIEALDIQGRARCSWIVKGKVQRDSFPKEVLEPDEPDDPDEPDGAGDSGPCVGNF